MMLGMTPCSVVAGITLKMVALPRVRTSNTIAPVVDGCGT